MPDAVYVDTVATDVPAARRMLTDAGFRVDAAVATTSGAVVAAAGSAQVLLVGDSPIDADVIAALPGLRLIATVTVGVDHIDLDAAREAGVWVANAPGAATEEVAVTTLAMALGLVRHLPFLDRETRAGGWDAFATGSRRRPSTLTLGIAGMGRIGRRLAALALPLFGRVVAHDPAPAGPWPTDVEALDWPALLAASDVLSLHAPALPGAPPLIDRAALAALPAGAFLVNAARGALVDTDALLAALDEGRLAGAALDVVADEPPAADAAVRRHPRVLLTPHAAFWSEEAEAAAYERQAENAIAWLRTGRPLTVVVEGAPAA